MFRYSYKPTSTNQSLLIPSCAAGAGFQSLNDAIDTNTPTGKLTFHLFAALAEFERDIIRERTKAGLAAARGRKGVRPKGLSKEAQHKSIIAAKLYKAGKPTTQQICDDLNIARNTLYSYLRHQNVEIGNSQIGK